MNLVEYSIANKDQIFSYTIEHIQLTAIAVGLAIVIGVPLGILISYVKKLNKPILSMANIIQAIPSMALLGFAIPFLGIGTLPSVVMVVLYSLLPIIKNTFIGLENINEQTLEAAKGIGLTKSQVLTKIQLPLALPVIMAGVRISAVTAVGLMTMAAFIGAGGLGFLVFSGIRTVNNNQILMGAIPACLLALSVDYLAGLVEKIVTPISLQANNQSTVELRKTRNHQKRILVISAIAVVITFGFSMYQNQSKDSRTLTIGSKDYTEQGILANLYADLIENRTDITVRRKIDLGGTQVAFGALKNGDIDMYIEYSGTAYGTLLELPINSNMEEVYITVKEQFKEKFNLEVLPQLNFNNTYTLAVTKETAQKYNLKTISDLAKTSSLLTSGTTFEFLNRDDGLPGLTKHYNFKFKKSIGVDSSPRYLALVNKEVDVIDAFSTDGLLKKFDLVILQDDKNFFPPYFALPVIRPEVLEKYPELTSVINVLGEYLTEEVMMELNYMVDELQMSPATVAHDFLIKIDLLQ